MLVLRVTDIRNLAIEIHSLGFYRKILIMNWLRRKINF